MNNSATQIRGRRPWLALVLGILALAGWGLFIYSVNSKIAQKVELEAKVQQERERLSGENDKMKGEYQRLRDTTGELKQIRPRYPPSVKKQIGFRAFEIVC